MIFKNYKKLYEQSLEEKQDLYDELETFKKENREVNNLIKQLKLDNKSVVKENRKCREEIAKLKIELEDTKGFLAQETQAKEKIKEMVEECTQASKMLKKQVKEEKTLGEMRIKTIINNTEPKKRGRKPKNILDNKTIPKTSGVFLDNKTVVRKSAIKNGK